MFMEKHIPNVFLDEIGGGILHYQRGLKMRTLQVTMQ